MPQQLTEKQKEQYRTERQRMKYLKEMAPKCRECEHFGDVSKLVKHKGHGAYELHRCDIHPKTFNTEFSFGCTDWKRKV